VQILVACTILIQNIGGELFTFIILLNIVHINNITLLNVNLVPQRQRVRYLFLFCSLSQFEHV